MAVTLAKVRGLVSEDDEVCCSEELRQLPGSVQHALNLEPQIAAWAQQFAKKTSALFLGRGIHYPIALEGALKLKEITYIHAEAYLADELKHGPLALRTENMPVVVIAPNDSLLDKVKANVQVVGVRGGELFVFADLDSNLMPPMVCTLSAHRATSANCPPSCILSPCSFFPTMSPSHAAPM